MTDTAHDTEEEMVEHFDDPTKLKEKIKQLAQMIRESEHLVCFTGAGISTSAGTKIIFFKNGCGNVKKYVFLMEFSKFDGNYDHFVWYTE